MRRTPLKKQSLKQRNRETVLRALKSAHILATIAAQGYVSCDECGLSFSDAGSARSGLQQHHVQQRSLGGKDDVENLVYLCWKCHGEKHP